jgi:hypothetical protein
MVCTNDPEAVLTDEEKLIAEMEERIKAIIEETYGEE